MEHERETELLEAAREIIAAATKDLASLGISPSLYILDSSRSAKACQSCSTLFVPTSSRNIFCSPTCKNRATQARINATPERKEAKRIWHNNRYNALRAEGKTRDDINTTMKLEHHCAYCGAVTKRIYCDNDCRRAHETIVRQSLPA